MRRADVWRRIARLLQPFAGRMLMAAMVSVLTVLSSVGLMGTSAWLLSVAALQGSIADLGVGPTAVRFFGLGRAVFRYLERLISHDVTFRLLRDVRVWFYQAIVPLVPAGLETETSGDLLSRIVNDVDAQEDIYLRALGPPVVAALVAIAASAVFAAFDGLAALVLLGFMIVAGTTLPWLTRQQGRGPGRRRALDQAALNTALLDTIYGVSDTLVYGQREAQLARLMVLAGALDDDDRAMYRLDAIQLALGDLIIHAAMLAVLLVAIPRIDSTYLGTLALATVAAFEAIAPLPAAAAHLEGSLTSAERLFTLANQEPVVPPVSAAAPTVLAEVGVALRDVSFRYSADAPLAVERLNLRVRPGERVAVVGPSGAGKSTLAKLLLRFYLPEQGDIHLGGVPLAALPDDVLYRAIGVMQQDTFLFNTTLRENIRLGRPNASDDNVLAAAEAAQLGALIAQLPDGADTWLGEQGLRLSGGERQRVALARLLLQDAPVLLLDEPTANLDAVTEQAVLERVLAATAGKTVLMISHRLTMLAGFDQIIVLDRGRIVQHGDFASLLADHDGLFARMYRQQTEVLVA